MKFQRYCAGLEKHFRKTSFLFTLTGKKPDNVYKQSLACDVVLPVKTGTVRHMLHNNTLSKIVTTILTDNRVPEYNGEECEIVLAAPLRIKPDGKTIYTAAAMLNGIPFVIYMNTDSVYFRFDGFVHYEEQENSLYPGGKLYRGIASYEYGINHGNIFKVRL